MLLISIPCYASTVDIGTPISKEPIPVIIINNSFPNPDKFEIKIKSDLQVLLLGQIEKSLSDKYQITKSEAGSCIADLGSTEKSDILQLFQGTNYSVAILAEILPIQQVPQFFQAPDANTTIHVKILDIKNEKYLYNGKLQDTEGSSRQAIKKINTMLDKILVEKLIKQ